MSVETAWITFATALIGLLAVVISVAYKIWVAAEAAMTNAAATRRTSKLASIFLLGLAVLLCIFPETFVVGLLLLILYWYIATQFALSNPLTNNRHVLILYIQETALILFIALFAVGLQILRLVKGVAAVAT